MDSPLTISNYFIKKSFETGNELTPMKLIKLTYIAHGWNLALTDSELIDEPVFAWQYGPVISSVYRSFKSYGDGKILAYVDAWNVIKKFPNDNNILLLLDKVWDVYKQFNGVQLSALTHQPDTPWDIVWNQQGGKNQRDVIIPNNLIKTYYKALIAKQ